MLQVTGELAHHEDIHQRAGLVIDHRPLLVDRAFELGEHPRQWLAPAVLDVVADAVVAEAEARGVDEVAHAARAVALELGHGDVVITLRLDDTLLDGSEAAEAVATLGHADVMFEGGVVISERFGAHGGQRGTQPRRQLAE